MATRKFTLAMGKKSGQVLEAAGSAIPGGNAIEVNIDFTGAMTRGLAIRTLKRLEKYLLTCHWPPA